MSLTSYHALYSLHKISRATFFAFILCWLLFSNNVKCVVIFVDCRTVIVGVHIQFDLSGIFRSPPLPNLLCPKALYHKILYLLQQVIRAFLIMRQKICKTHFLPDQYSWSVTSVVEEASFGQISLHYLEVKPPLDQMRKLVLLTLIFNQSSISFSF